LIAMLQIHPIPAFTDNYIWCLHDGAAAFVVDPGAAEPVLAFLQQRQLRLSGILITHHHADHTGGIAALLQHYPAASVYGPHNPRIAGITQALRAGEVIDVCGLRWQVLAVPGHTLDHIAYYSAAHQPPLLFCGDTLFAAGCGRLFEGSPAQMYASLRQLAQLPAATAVYCAHEYTLSNLRFAAAAEPASAAVAERLATVARLRDGQVITLPSSVALELETNPFLRCHLPALKAAAQRRDPAADSPEQVFAALRGWKDQF
jgi:hydroxyacylglutathione hydrolase